MDNILKITLNQPNQAPPGIDIEANRQEIYKEFENESSIKINLQNLDSLVIESRERGNEGQYKFNCGTSLEIRRAMDEGPIKRPNHCIALDSQNRTIAEVDDPRTIHLIYKNNQLRVGFNLTLDPNASRINNQEIELVSNESSGKK